MKSFCTACKKTFRSMAGFDAHRAGSYQDGTRRCLTTEEMLSKGMAINSDRVWVASLYPEGIRRGGRNDAQ